MPPQILLALLTGVPLATASGAGAIVGSWLTEEGKARVEVRLQGDEVRGRIVWLEQPNYPPDDPQGMGGDPVVDRLNRDEQLRRRPILGLEILTGFRYAVKGEWRGGRLYDPERGESYKGRLKLTPEGKLKLRGYVAIPAFGRSSVWTRVVPETPARD